MTMIKLSDLKKGVVGIVGHAGCGHANSHLGFIQDDSGGLSSVVRLLQLATGIDLKIVEVNASTGLENAFFEVKTQAGGVGVASARRGITPEEERLAQYIVGRQAVNSQALAVMALGRILGQGANEAAVALQTAIANASVDSFKKSFPENFILGDEQLEGNCGKILGTVVEIDGVPASVLAVVNATEGGLGPNEDIEGNVNLFGKRQMMADLGLDKLPTIIIEGKVYAQPISGEIREPTFVIRANENDDNPAVAGAIEEAARELSYQAKYYPKLLARSENAMRDLTRQMGERVISLGEKLAKARTAREKVLLAADLNLFCSQEDGGLTFMSEDVHLVMGGVGQFPGASAVMSLFVPYDSLRRTVLPSLSLSDVERFVTLVCAAAGKLNARLEEANKIIEGQRKA